MTLNVLYNRLARYVKWRQLYAEKRVDPALVLWSAAILLCACAFFLGRATVRGPVLETQHAAPGGAAQDAWISQVEKKTASAAEGSGRVCLNTATMEELLELPGVGEKTAERILAYRDTYGKFVTTQQLLDVEGIGEGLLEKLRPYVYVEEIE